METNSGQDLVFVDIADQLIEDVVETEWTTHQDDIAMKVPKLVYFL
jgi:hypothetical protein